MRALIVGMMLAASPAWACNTEMIAVDDWSVTKDENSSINVQLNYRNTADRGYRMIDGYVLFSDALGSDLDAVNIPRDVPLGAGESISQDIRAGVMTRLQRLPDIHPDDISISTCVRGVVYSDGESESF